MSVDLDNRIPRIALELNRVTNRGVREVAEDVADNAKRRAYAMREALAKGKDPHPGRLGDSIHLEGRGQNVQVVADAQDQDGQPYGWYVEGGTKKMAAQPFMRPAAEAARAGVELKMRGKLKKLSG